MIGMDFGAFLTLLIFGVDRIDRRARHRSVSDAGGRRWFRLGADGGLDRGLARFPCPRPLVVPGPRCLHHPCVGGSVCRRLLMRSPDEGKCALYLQGHGTEGKGRALLLQRC